MADEHRAPEDAALAAALDSYLAELQAGLAPDRAALLARHPELAKELECLDALDRLAPAAAPPPTPEHITDFGRYELLEEIGRGGMGVVYKARQKDLDRVVALKVILAGRLASPDVVRRFDAEARVAARIQHPNIVRVLEAGEIHGQHYFAMEFVAGSSLDARLTRGPLDPAEAARLLATVARAVAHLHAQGIVHRDLKPSNILLDESGEPRVTDFGLAKLLEPGSQQTQSGIIAGTPAYMSPEQAAGRAAQTGPLSDVYSLGAILYEMLTGRPVFRAESPLDTLVMVLESEPVALRQVNARVPRELEMICLRCLEKSPAQRYPSAAALADDLDRFLKGEPVEARPPGAWPQVRRWSRREPALSSRLAGLTVCAAIAQVNYSLTHSVPFALHAKIMAAMAVWALVSLACQWAMRRERWAAVVRFVWGGADVALLTAVLEIDEALASPLVALYPALIVASGLWFRVPVVAVTTAAAVIGYVWLLAAECWRTGQTQVPQPHWHLMFLATLVLVGFVVAYQVHRVRALSRYYERRPLP
ncbi:MAG: serine/threonine protein kinase [Verrucomicrobia bacterium]|nr:serine/threonine protein kinase [Verrucomicrobiota bacterium]